MTGVSVRTYRNWETGETVPYPGKGLRRLIAVMRTTNEYLLHGVREDADAFD